jgi:hypothetical protein
MKSIDQLRLTAVGFGSGSRSKKGQFAGAQPAPLTIHPVRALANDLPGLAPQQNVDAPVYVPTLLCGRLTDALA